MEWLSEFIKQQKKELNRKQCMKYQWNKEAAENFIKNKHRKKYPSLYLGDQWSMRVCACVGNEHLNIFAEILERRQQQH